MKRRNRTRFLISASLILFTGFFLRLTLVNFYGLEGDDGVSIQLIRHDAGELIDGLMAQRLDVHPPLYFLTLKAWTAAAGDSLIALRLINILIDTLTGALVMRIGGRTFSRQSALVGGILWAVAPLLISTGFLIRMYTLLAGLFAAGFACIVEAEQTRRIRWYGLAAACALAAGYTHIIGFVAFAAFGLVIAVRAVTNRSSTKVSLAGLAWLGLAGILYLPFAIPVWNLYRSGRSLGASYSRSFANLPEIPGAILTTELAHRLLDSPAAGFAALVIVAWGSWAVWRHYRERALSLLTFFAATLVIMGALAWFAEMYKPRYLAAFTPIMLALVAGILLLVRPRIWRNLAFLVAAGLSLAAVMVDLDYGSRDDWTAAAAFIAQHELPGDSVIVIPDWGAEAFNYHYNGAAPVTGILSGVSQDMNPDQILGPLVTGHGRVWLVRYQVEVSDPDNLADNWFRTQAVTVTEVFPTSIQVKYYNFSPQVENLPTFARPLDAVFGGSVRLHGVLLPVLDGSARDQRLHPPSNWVQVYLYWEALQPGIDFVPRARLTDIYGQVYGAALERDNDLLHRFPVTTWNSGQIWEVAYDLNVNPETPPGTYNIEVMVLDPETGQPLPSEGKDAGEYWVVAGQFRVFK